MVSVEEGGGVWRWRGGGAGRILLVFESPPGEGGGDSHFWLVCSCVCCQRLSLTSQHLILYVSD